MLSIEEKREAIRNYCDRNYRECRESCKDPCALCPIAKVRKNYEHCWSEAITKENSPNIERNYQLLVEAGLIKSKDKEDKTRNIRYNQKHYYGYIFDSLVYRYQLAREKQARYEVEVEGISPINARTRMGMETCRFIEILNEIMPEHD